MTDVTLLIMLDYTVKGILSVIKVTDQLTLKQEDYVDKPNIIT